MTNNSLALVVVTATLTEVEKSNKKGAFNVLVTDEGKQKYYLKALIKEIAKYPFLKQQSWCSRTKTISQASYLDVVVFGGNSNYDFTTENHSSRIPMNNPSFDLNTEFSKVAKALKKYAELNYPDKFKKEESMDITINIEIVRPSKKVVSKKETTVLRRWQTYRIHETWVKIGFKQFDIYVDTLTGDEYIKVGGERIFILEDRNGEKYLA